jgi:hypothetical protein
MTRLKRSRPSPALVVGVLALVAALAGTAIAADPVATTSISKKKTKKIARNQAVKQIDLAFEEAFPVTSAEFGTINTREQSFTIATGTSQSQTVSCQTGEKVISGGGRFNTDPLFTTAWTQYDYRVENGWRAGGLNASGAPQQYTVYAYCLEP